MYNNTKRAKIANVHIRHFFDSLDLNYPSVSVLSNLY